MFRRSTVLDWCTIDVWTPWTYRGVPTGLPRTHRARDGRPVFIRGPRFGQLAAPIGAKGRGRIWAIGCEDLPVLASSSWVFALYGLVKLDPSDPSSFLGASP